MSRSLAGAAGAGVGGLTAWAVSNVSGLVAWAFSTEEVWFSLAATYDRYIAPQFGVAPDLGPVLLVLALVYAAARIQDLRTGGDDDDQ